MIPLSNQFNLKEKLDQLHSQLITKIENNQLQCECEPPAPICFECLRNEAEIILADDFNVNINEDNLENYANNFEDLLDKTIVSVLQGVNS